MQKEFNALDKDKSGTIDPSEIKGLFAQVPGVPEAILDQAISSVDKNSDGKLSFEEYKEVRSKLGGVKIPPALAGMLGGFM